jgi:hypothetical protein
MGVCHSCACTGARIPPLGGIGDRKIRKEGVIFWGHHRAAEKRQLAHAAQQQQEREKGREDDAVCCKLKRCAPVWANAPTVGAEQSRAPIFHLGKPPSITDPRARALNACTISGLIT